MSIEKGDEVVTVEGIVGNVIDVRRAGILELPDHYTSSENTIRADDPLRVRVDSEQEARIVLDMAEQHGWVISTNFDHWKLSQINCVSLDRGHVNTYCTNRDTTCRHGVPFSGRKSQIRKYLSYNSEEDGGLREAIEKGRKDYEEGETTPHEDVFDSGDQPAEDDDEWEAGVEREIAERFLRNDPIPDVPVSEIYKAIRDHCELSDSKIEWPVCHYCEPEGKTEPIMESEQAVTIHQYHLEELSDEEDGVCEWTKDGDTVHPECHEADYATKIIDIWNFCPGCKGEITTDEGGKFEVGDVVRDTQYREGDPNTVREYFYIQEVRDYDTEFKYAGKSFELREDVVDDLEKVGSFKPDDDALERVKPECNGSLFLKDDKVLFDPLCRTDDIKFVGSVEMLQENGRKYTVVCAEATGIVINFHEIAEVSGVSNLHLDA